MADQTPTPEEVAEQVIKSATIWHDGTGTSSLSISALKDAIFFAITAAVAREREACAKVASNHQSAGFGDDWSSGETCAARDIAAAIRARQP